MITTLANVGNELLEVSVLSNEVGLGVYLDDCAYAALITYGSLDQTLGSDAVCLLGSLSQALLTEQLDSLVEVAVGSVSAFLQSIMPAPVISLSSFTSAAVTAIADVAFSGPLSMSSLIKEKNSPLESFNA